MLLTLLNTLSRSLLLTYNSFAYLFIAYVSTHLLFYTYSLISNKKKHNSNTKHITSKIKPIVLII